MTSRKEIYLILIFSICLTEEKSPKTILYKIPSQFLFLTLKRTDCVLEHLSEKTQSSITEKVYLVYFEMFPKEFQ